MLVFVFFSEGVCRNTALKRYSPPLPIKRLSSIYLTGHIKHFIFAFLISWHRSIGFGSLKLSWLSELKGLIFWSQDIRNIEYDRLGFFLTPLIVHELNFVHTTMQYHNITICGISYFESILLTELA